MTTRTTTITTNTKSMRAVIAAAAASLAMLGGTLLWQALPASETATPVATTRTGTSSEGAAPMGGLAEQYHDEQQARAAREAGQVTTRGGMAEHYAEQPVPVAATEPITTTGGMAELYAERQAAARDEVARLARMGGMAELYRDQAAATSAR